MRWWMICRVWGAVEASRADSWSGRGDPLWKTYLPVTDRSLDRLPLVQPGCHSPIELTWCLSIFREFDANIGRTTLGLYARA
jgi:hypothetical protein